MGNPVSSWRNAFLGIIFSAVWGRGVKRDREGGREGGKEELRAKLMVFDEVGGSWDLFFRDK